MLWRYGYRSPTTTSALVQAMINTYLNLYSTVTHWGSVEELSASLNFTEIVGQDTAAYLASQGVGDAYAYEIVEASTRVNYAQNLDKIHALEGMCSMASDGAMSIKGGNYQVFENFIRESKASLHLNTHVTALESKSAGRWQLTASKNGAAPFTEEYDAVILAAPYDSLAMTLPSSAEPVTPAPYVHLHVTLLATTSPSASAEYFNQAPGTSVPAMVLTTAQGIRAGKPAPEFNSLSYHRQLTNGEWIVKIFSMQRVEDDWLLKVFGNVGWVYRKVWDAYPQLPPTAKFNPMKLDKNLYYVNGFETFISTMETETIASRGVVDLMLREMFDEGICPSGVSEPPPEGVDFVWGWDC
ncbi:hypothetical protein M408DRAFT_198508 [Serendipita vermifera MAFF 305830]|uniref:Prenylcysteine lyase domain-containing protein n=1 Tax=Serendipita vermifera MAFF 305830 TaxID=933852 RepID=A0A0C3AN61_SERVB|nr:hypothetical protein M408DRAFT_198508 [Serendipita vermifera MAFF 305830]